MQNLQHTEVNLWPFMVNALRKYEVYQMPFLNASFIFEFIFCIHDSLQLGPSLGKRSPSCPRPASKSTETVSLVRNSVFTAIPTSPSMYMSATSHGQSKYRWGHILTALASTWILLCEMEIHKTNVSKMIWSSLIWKSFIQLCTGISLHLMVQKIESALKWQCVMLPDA